jgi:hypothetical protein
LDVWFYALTVKARKDGGGGGSVEAFIVKTDANSHFQLPASAGLQRIIPRGGKSIKMDVRNAVVKWEQPEKAAGPGWRKRRGWLGASPS